MARILIVDDQPAVLLLLDSILVKQGHVVTSAADGRDALDKLSRFPFDLVVTDAIMPGGVSGFDVSRTIRTTPSISALPVVILTGKREKKDVEQGIQSGADDYIVKPVDPDIFVNKITRLLKEHRPDSMTFATCAANHPVAWDVKTRIVSVSEAGMRVRSSLAAPEGTKVKLNGSIFAEIGIDAPQLRVVACAPAKDEPGTYDVEVVYIGLTERDLQPLRLWVRSHQINKSAS